MKKFYTHEEVIAHFTNLFEQQWKESEERYHEMNEGRELPLRDDFRNIALAYYLKGVAAATDHIMRS